MKNTEALSKGSSFNMAVSQEHDKLRELYEEEEHMKLRILQADAGLIRGKDLLVTAERMDWMYLNPVQANKQATETSIFSSTTTDGPKSKEEEHEEMRRRLNQNAARSGALFLSCLTMQSDDTLRRLREDPLFVIRQAEHKQHREDITRLKILKTLKKARKNQDKNKTKKLGEDSSEDSDSEPLSSNEKKTTQFVSDTKKSKQKKVTNKQLSISQAQFKRDQSVEIIPLQYRDVCFKRKYYDSLEKKEKFRSINDDSHTLISKRHKKRKFDFKHAKQERYSRSLDRSSTSLLKTSTCSRRQHVKAKNIYSRHHDSGTIKSDPSNRRQSSRDKFRKHFDQHNKRIEQWKNYSHVDNRVSHKQSRQSRRKALEYENQTFSKHEFSFEEKRDKSPKQSAVSKMNKTKPTYKTCDTSEDKRMKQTIRAHSLSPSQTCVSSKDRKKKQTFKNKHNDSFPNRKSRRSRSFANSSESRDKSESITPNQTRYSADNSKTDNDECLESKNGKINDTTVNSVNHTSEPIKDNKKKKFASSSPSESEAPIQGPVLPLEWRARLSSQKLVSEKKLLRSSSESVCSEDSSSSSDLAPPEGMAESLEVLRSKKSFHPSHKMKHSGLVAGNCNFRKRQEDNNIFLRSPKTEKVEDELEQMKQAGRMHEHNKDLTIYYLEQAESLQKERDEKLRKQQLQGEQEPQFAQKMIQSVYHEGEASSLSERLKRYAARRKLEQNI